jgi:hypothetical protein
VIIRGSTQSSIVIRQSTIQWNHPAANASARFTDIAFILHLLAFPHRIAAEDEPANPLPVPDPMLTTEGLRPRGDGRTADKVQTSAYEHGPSAVATGPPFNASNALCLAGLRYAAVRRLTLLLPKTPSAKETIDPCCAQFEIRLMSLRPRVSTLKSLHVRRVGFCNLLFGNSQQCKSGVVPPPRRREKTTSLPLFAPSCPVNPVHPVKNIGVYSRAFAVLLSIGCRRVGKYVPVVPLCHLTFLFAAAALM